MSVERSERMYPTRPFVGVGAVVWDGQHVLLERRGRPPRAGIWALPGGLIELGETAAEAVRREVREECAVEVEVGPLLGLFEPVELAPDGRVYYHFVVIDFLAFYRSGELAAGDDADEVCWVRPADLAAFDLSQSVHEMIDRALAHVA